MNKKQSDPSNVGQTRRDFIKQTAGVAAAVGATGVLKTPVYGQNQAPAAGRAIGANDRIGVAYIGVGSQGTAHMRHQKTHAKDNNIAQLAVCDVWQKRLDAARNFLGLTETDAFRDHRKLLERKDIDAVVISTIDNWHAQVTLDALAAGKHVFCEKPMTRYLGEAFEIYDAVKKSGKTYIIGSQ